MVGMLPMHRRNEGYECCSVSSFRNPASGSSCVAERSKYRAVAWQAPQHGARKSTTTGKAPRPTMSPKFGVRGRRMAVERRRLSFK
jgi:hypothetical protein